MRVVEKAVYRSEQGRTCIDLRVQSAAQLFDRRDPAPFGTRDLDASVAEYIYSSALDIAPRNPLKIVLWLEKPLAPPLTAATIEDALRSHFSQDGHRVRHRLRQQRRFGRFALVGGLSILVVFLSLAEVLHRATSSHMGEIFRQGLVIAGWVALWKPIEVLFYDWWPLKEEERQAERIAGSPVEVCRATTLDGTAPS